MTAPATELPPASKPPAGVRFRNWIGNNALRIYAVLAFFYLLLPVMYTFVFSFNDSGKSNLTWIGFTWDNWANPCGAPEVCPAVINSITVGLTVTVVATILGTLIAFALVRHRFRGRTSTNLLIFLPMATPEVVLGSSLLTLFLNMVIPLGFWTVVLAHIMFCISFVVVTSATGLDGPEHRTGCNGPVRLRMAGVPPNHAATSGPRHRRRRPVGVLAVV